MTARTLEADAAFILPVLEAGLEVLDAGCGPGTITQGIAEAVLPGRVTGFDREPAAVALASRLAEGRELTNAHFTAGSIYELPFADASFDLVFAHALFEHLADPAAALDECRRVLRPGGIIALCSPDWDAFEMRPGDPAAVAAVREYRLLQEINGGNTRAGAELAGWLECAGFRVLAEGSRTDDYESAPGIAEYLAAHLDGCGKADAAAALREWALRPGARLAGCWKHAVGIRWNG